MYYRLNERVVNSGNYIKDILEARGINNIDEYLNPSKEDLFPADKLKNIDKGVDLLLTHLKNNSKIYVVVDCDNDGITSAAGLILYINNIYPNANIYWTMHDGKQHGVELSKVEEDTKLVIIPDAGSNQYEEHKELSDRGIDVLVIDHHESEYYSDYAIVINNQMCDYPNKSLSGAGVVYKFLQKLDEVLKIDYADLFLDLAATGIVGDMMLLQDLETRYIVSYGLSHINNFGLKTLIKKQEFSIGDINNISPNDISFYITPLINAIIRVGTMEEKETLFKSFISGQELVPSTKRGHKVGDTEVCAEQAARYGTNCRSRQNKILDAGVDYLAFKIQKEELNDNQIIFVRLDEEEEERIPSELTGLIAMKLVQKFGKPTIVTRLGNDNEWSGSLRGLNNSDFSDFKGFLNESGMFTYAEGHANAAGVKINNSKVDKFIEYSNDKLSNFNFGETSYIVDYEFNSENLSDIYNMAIQLDEIKSIWGRGIEEPKIAINGLSYTSDDIQVMGRTADTSKITKNGISFIRFKDSIFANKITKYDYGIITLIGRVQINEWAGRRSAQVIIEDYEILDDKCSF